MPMQFRNQLQVIFLYRAWFLTLSCLAVCPAYAQTATNYDNVGIETLPNNLRGNSECFSNLSLAFAVSGLIADLNTQEGATVAQGDILTLLDQSTETLEVERRHQIWLDRTELEAAQIKQDVALRQYNAAKTLQSAGGAISLEEVQNRKLSSDLAAVEVERLKRQESIQELEYKSAQDALSKRRLVAPTNSIVSEIIKKPGESAQAYEPVIKLCDIQKIVFVSNLPENIITTLQEGDELPLQFTNIADPVIGKIKLISPLVDAATGLRKIKMDLPDGLPWLRPGLTADLILPQ